MPTWNADQYLKFEDERTSRAETLSRRAYLFGACPEDD